MRKKEADNGGGEGAQNELPRIVPVRRRNLQCITKYQSKMRGNWLVLEIGPLIGLLS